MSPHAPTTRTSVLIRPGRRMGRRAQQALIAELRAVAAACFEGEAPRYQALSGEDGCLDDVVLCLARDAGGALVGFCSCLLIAVPGVGEVFHLGLSCVAPGARGGGLTHALISKAATAYLLRTRPWGSVWVSNVACVLSSLGNVALHFDEVYPAPRGPAAPSPAHRAVAEAIAARYRPQIAISPAATLDLDTFVFRGSVPGTCFEKDAEDPRYLHRDGALNRWYGARMRFEDGDEQLQVGRMSVWGALRHAAARLLGGRAGGPRALPAPVPVDARAAA